MAKHFLEKIVKSRENFVVMLEQLHLDPFSHSVHMKLELYEIPLRSLSI